MVAGYFEQRLPLIGVMIRRIGVITVTIWLCAISFAIMWLATDVERFIRVSAIHVYDGYSQAPISVEVARVIHRNFEGSYRVVIRRADTGLVVCDTGRVDISYRIRNDDGSIRVLPNPMYLRWWAYGGDCFTGDIRTGTGAGALALRSEHGVRLPHLQPGLYSQETYHGVRRFWGMMPPRWHGWDVTTFRILGE